jgi:hypothetical protein
MIGRDPKWVAVQIDQAKMLIYRTFLMGTAGLEPATSRV